MSVGRYAPVFRVVLLLGSLGVLFIACGKPASSTVPARRASATPAAFHRSLKTSDGVLLLQVSVTPNRLGPNLFLIDVTNAKSGKRIADEQVQIFTTMLDMEMATGVIMLQASGNGRYLARGTLPMDGNWDMHIQLLDATRSSDDIHVAKLKVYIPG